MSSTDNFLAFGPTSDYTKAVRLVAGAAGSRLSCGGGKPSDFEISSIKDNPFLV